MIALNKAINPMSCVSFTGGSQGLGDFGSFGWRAVLGGRNWMTGDYYTMLGLRSVLVPATNFGSRFSYIVFFLGLLLRSRPLLMVGVGLFFMAVLFAIVTLPVEWNATARAKKAMVVSGIVTEQERHEAAQVLNAAFLTYVASAVTAILTLLYYLLRSGLLGGRRD